MFRVLYWVWYCVLISIFRELISMRFYKLGTILEAQVQLSHCESLYEYKTKILYFACNPSLIHMSVHASENYLKSKTKHIKTQRKSLRRFVSYIALSISKFCLVRNLCTYKNKSDSASMRIVSFLSRFICSVSSCIFIYYYILYRHFFVCTSSIFFRFFFW